MQNKQTSKGKAYTNLPNIGKLFSFLFNLTLKNTFSCFFLFSAPVFVFVYLFVCAGTFVLLPFVFVH